jgi:predicted DNA-binding ribbon-helix-helix protein
VCQIFAGQDPENYSYVSRSIRLDGQVTSIRLEGLYWSVLDDVAQSQGFTTPEFISKLHREVMELRGAPKTSPHYCALPVSFIQITDWRLA